MSLKHPFSLYPYTGIKMQVKYSQNTSAYCKTLHFWLYFNSKISVIKSIPEYIKLYKQKKPPFRLLPKQWLLIVYMELMKLWNYRTNEIIELRQCYFNTCPSFFSLNLLFILFIYHLFCFKSF